jgi:hypothetical protein
MTVNLDSVPWVGNVPTDASNAIASSAESIPSGYVLSSQG